MWPLIIGQAIISAAFCAYVASQKNRDYSIWLLLGFICGIFALIAIAAVPAIPRANRQHMSHATGIWACPSCGEVNDTSNPRCSGCGYDRDARRLTTS